jgi:hypothetical protein
MNNADAIKERLEKVKDMKSYTEAICALADTQYEIGIDACRERKKLQERQGEIQQDLRLLKVVVLGNGNPNESIVARLTNVEKILNEKVVNRVDELIGLLQGKEGEAGFCERVRDLEKARNNINKLAWAILLVFIGEIVMRIIGIL